MFLRAGAYAEAVAIKNAGAPSKPIVFAAFGDDEVILEGADAVAADKWRLAPNSKNIYALALERDPGRLFVDGKVVYPKVEQTRKDYPRAYKLGVLTDGDKNVYDVRRQGEAAAADAGRRLAGEARGPRARSHVGLRSGRLLPPFGHSRKELRLHGHRRIRQPLRRRGLPRDRLRRRHRRRRLGQSRCDRSPQHGHRRAGQRHFPAGPPDALLGRGQPCRALHAQPDSRGLLDRQHQDEFAPATRSSRTTWSWRRATPNTDCGHDGWGLWGDINIVRVAYVGNTCANNKEAGIYVEYAMGDTRAYFNTSYRNGHGITCRQSQRGVFMRNLVLESRGSGLAVWGGDAPYSTTDHVFAHNLVRDCSPAIWFAIEHPNFADYNTYWPRKDRRVAWGETPKGGQTPQYKDLADWIKATGHDLHSKVLDAEAGGRRPGHGDLPRWRRQGSLANADDGRQRRVRV